MDDRVVMSEVRTVAAWQFIIKMTARIKISTYQITYANVRHYIIDAQNIRAISGNISVRGVVKPARRRTSK